METATVLTLFFAGLGGLAGFAGLAGALWCRRVAAGLRQQVHELAGRVQQMEDPARGGSDGENRVLSRDQLAARFERMDNMQTTDVSAKYRHVARLARSGLGSTELSEILDVSLMEAEQMLLLAKTAGKTA